MIIECPHCHTRVLPKSDNTCPACRNNLSDLEDIDPNQVAIVIRESDELPSFCYSCNSYTERYVKLEGEEESVISKAILTLAEILMLQPKLVFGKNETGTTNVYIYLPQCERCAEAGKPEPLHVDFEHQTMTFLGHVGFRDRVYKLHGIDPNPRDKEDEGNQEEN